MKTKKHYLILSIVIGILCVPALAEEELLYRLAEEELLYRPAERGLIGQVNPTLAGIEQLYVVIVPPDSEPNSKTPLANEIEEKVKSKVNKAGIKTIRGIAANILHTGELRVDIDALKLEDSQQYVFRIQTSLSRMVHLAKTDEPLFKADVWKTEPVMQAVSVENTSTRVTGMVLKQLETFINAYSAANPPGGQPTGVNTVSIASKEQTSTAAKSTVAKYKYVASKNSKVFHGSDCSSAKRISPKNLIGYNSKDEAIKAAKRPCKICKP